jgi:hypothetical protein
MPAIKEISIMLQNIASVMSLSPYVDLYSMKTVNASIREKLEDNIFIAAHQAIIESCGSWDEYPWHWGRNGIDSHRENSSQALSIDVFGTIKAFSNQAARDAVMNALAAELGIEPDQGWKIDLEWIDKKKNILKELRQTQVDVKAQGQRTLILMECKFTEQDGGSCSQVKPLQKGKYKGICQCDGSYRVRVNPVNGKAEYCALTAKGIRYWDLIPNIFELDSRQEYEECPFRGGWFQWMRNLVLCRELAGNGLQPKVAVVYVDSPSMPFKQKMESGEWAEFLETLKKKDLLGTLSYQRVLELGAEALNTFEAERQTWEELKRHVQGKIARVESGKL